MAKPQWANWSWGETPCYHPPKSFDTERPTVESHPVGENWLGSLWFTGHILFCLFLGVLIVKNTFSVLLQTHGTFIVIDRKHFIKY